MKLMEKLHAIYGKIDYIEKMGMNGGQHYAYLQASDVIREIRQQLYAQRVYAEINFEFAGPPYVIARHKEPDAPFSVVNVKCFVTFHDLDSLETATGSGLGSGGDLGDKAAYKAQTGALKYALKNSFLVPDAPGAPMDPEADSVLDGTSAPEIPTEEGHPAPRPQPAPKVPEPMPADLTAIFGPPVSAATAEEPATAPEIPVVVSQREPGDESENEQGSSAPLDRLPNETEMNDFRTRFKALGDVLSLNPPEGGGLQSSKGLRLGVKLRVFVQQQEKVNSPSEMTVGQWEDFFARVETLRATENGLVKLAKLINIANGVEEKKGKKN